MSRIHEEFSTLLQDRVSPEILVRDLAAPGEWRPFPRIADRDGWMTLSATKRASLVVAGESHLGMEWPPLRATVFLEFVRTGNRLHYEVPHFARRQALLDLVLAECVENEGRFVEDIIDGLWAIMEESFWGVSAHSYSERFGRGLPDTSWPVVDLFAGETASLLAWSLYLVESVLAEVPQVPDRIRREVTNRILDPYRDVDSWAWFNNKLTGRAPNNWNPWIHSNVITCALLVDDDAARRAATIYRALEGTDRFLSGYFSDGGCDEGISYWGRAGACLYDMLDLLDRASDGKITYWDIPLVRDIGRYVTRAHIGGPWYINFADGAAKPVPDYNLIYRYGVRIDDDALQRQAAEAARSSGNGSRSRSESFGRRLASHFEPMPESLAESSPALEREVWLDGLEVLIAREQAGSTDGLFLAAKGGHNDESHNHLDVGQVIVGLDGIPYLIDVGVETYTRKTFSDQRYDIWTMQSQYHNLPTIDGHGQVVGYQARASDIAAALCDDAAQLTLDLAQAYPAEAGVANWTRTARLDRGIEPAVTLTDAWSLTREPHSLTLSLMSAFPVDIDDSGDLLIRGSAGALRVAVGSSDLQPVVETIPIDDGRLRPVWGDAVWRVVLSLAKPARHGFWTLRVLPA